MFSTIHMNISDHVIEAFSSFVQQMNVVFLVWKESQELRNSHKYLIGRHKYVHHDAFLKKKQQLFQINWITGTSIIWKVPKGCKGKR